MTAFSNADLLIQQARLFKPNAIAICDTAKLEMLKDALAGEDVKVYGGQESIVQLMSMDSIDLVLTAMVGFAGLEPTPKLSATKKEHRTC